MLTFSRFTRSIAIFLAALILPVFSFAASVQQTLTIADDAVISRGEFLRASIQVLGLATDKEKKTMDTYTRPVSRALVPYVRAAEKRSALTMFGSDLGLGRGITRGEALIIITKLQQLKPSGSDMRFTDVKGTDMDTAVRVAVEKKWMQPLRSSFFGVGRMLTGLEAKLLLRKVVGETGSIETGTSDTKVPVTVIQFKKKDIPQIPENDMLRAVWQLLNDKYLHTEKINDKAAAYGAAEALVKSLNDPYTVFMRPTDSKFFQTQIGGEVSGIGAQVEYKENKLLIVAPLSGSPAEKAGLKAGDQITKVDGVSLAGLTFIEAVDKVRGEKGSTVTLTVIRDGNESEIQVVRDTVRLPEIDISYQGNIAIVKLVQFGQTTDRQLRSLMIEVQEQDAQGIVLDLRNNPGGLLHAAEIVLSNFLPQGSGVAVIKSKDEEYTEVTADPPTIDEDVPVIVLVNKGSASASEIVAGALQDHKRAKLLGETTFGKGTVQQIVEFRDGSSMKMTIAEWLTPKRRKIDGVGVEPDVTVKATEGRDEVLLQAIDMLR